MYFSCDVKVHQIRSCPAISRQLHVQQVVLRRVQQRAVPGVAAGQARSALSRIKTAVGSPASAACM